MDDNTGPTPIRTAIWADDLKQLGAPVAIFKPDPRRLVVGVVLGLALCGCGVFFTWFGFSRDATRLAHPELERWGTMGIGGMIVLGGVFLLVWLRATWRFRVLVCPGGLIQIRGTVTEAFPWEDIVSVHERTTQVKLLKGPAPLVPKAASKVYWVNRSDGASIRFDADKLKNDERLCQMIHEEAIRRAIPWTEDAVVV
jgi:hypothetical protein